MAIDQNRAIADIIKARDQVDDGGFAAAGCPQKGNCRARLGAKTNVSQDGIAAVKVAEGDIAKFNVTLNGGQKLGIGSINDLILGVKNLKDAVGASAGLAHLADDEANLPHRGKDIEQIDGELLPFAD